MLDFVTTLLLKHEGIRLHPYTDTVGKLTIGIGRNLSAEGISEDEAYALLDADIAKCIKDLETFSWYDGLNEARQAVMVDLRFNLGMAGLKTFETFLDFMSQGRFKDAADDLLKTKWAEEVPNRAREDADILISGFSD